MGTFCVGLLLGKTLSHRVKIRGVNILYHNLHILPFLHINNYVNQNVNRDRGFSSEVKALNRERDALVFT